MRAAARPVEEGDLAHMLLDDLLDDREAEPGAPHARRHIGLGQPLAVLGKADAGVEHVDDEVARPRSCSFSSTRSPARLCSPRLRLLSMASTPFLTTFVSAWASWRRSQTIRNSPCRRLEREADRRMRDLVQEQRLARDLVDVLVAEHRLGHPREVGEFVDHPAEVADLADDRAGQPLERLLVGRDLLAEAALQPLGGELDRGQRVLDLMRDAPGDVRPGGAALVGQLVGDVVEGQHRPVLVAHALDRERALAAVGGDQHIGLRLLAAHELVELGRDRRQAPCLRSALALLEQGLGRAVEQQDAVLRIDRDDAGGDARQHRLDEGAAGVELGVGGAQRVGLLLEPPGHPVERGRQRLHLVLGLGDRHARREIAGLDPPGGVDQLADRPDQAVGEPQRGQDRQARR